MKTHFIYFILLSFLSPVTFQGQIIHVPGDEESIQAAIDIAEIHDTIIVDQGEYFENINFKGKNIVVCSNYIFSNDSTDLFNTIINGSNPIHPDTASCVLFVSGEDSTAVLAGFTITGGTGTRWEDEHGPNNWYTEGGGILIQYSSPTIRNNVITNNQAINVPAGTASAGGGAIRSGDGNPHILNNIISYNQGRYGGGIVMNYSGAVIKNNLIAYNSGGEDFGGGGLWFLLNGDDPLILVNNTIANNTSATNGGGIRFYSSITTATNNIIWGNTAVVSPQIQGNTGIITYSCVEGGYSGTGNIGSDPLFLSSSFILADNSPCIDAGNPDPGFNDPEDPSSPGNALYPSKGTISNDMGMYGGPGCCQNNPVLTHVSQPQYLKDGLDVYLAPNPVKNEVTINICSADQTEAMIQITDVTGKLIKDLGSYSINSIGSTISTNIVTLRPGLYFIGVTTANHREFFKILKE